MGAKYLRKRKRMPLIPILVVTILVFALAGVGGLVAKYRSEMRYEAEMIAANFHISSDMLEEENRNATHQVADWNTGIQIELYNYEKENVALVASEEISYEVLLSSEDFDYSIAPGGTFPGGEKSSHTLTITPKDKSVAADSLTVTVTTTSPFTKTLLAEFQRVGTMKPELKWQRITNNGDYYLATITTGQYTGTITLDWEDGLQPDNNNAVMESWASTPSENSFSAKAFTTYKLIFFNPNKMNNATMTLSTGN